MTAFFSGRRDVRLTDKTVSPRFTLTIFCPEDDGNTWIWNVGTYL